MARRIIWSAHAQEERKKILRYWYDRLGSNEYVTKLERRLRETLRIVARHPLIGRPTDHQGIRVKVMGDHLIFYAYDDRCITVVSLWDNRQDPASLQLVT
jgi:addiction module RelE/StbE family toxin